MKPKTVLFAFLSSLALTAYSPAPVNAQEDTQQGEDILEAANDPTASLMAI